MNKWLQDLKGTKGLMLFAPIIYYLILLSFIILSNKEYPPNPIQINEAGMIPFVIMITILFYQREFSGFFMEIYSTYPISYSWMVFRKGIQTLMITVVAHFVWGQIYLWRYERLQGLVFPADGSEPILREVSWGYLLKQAIPEYLLMIAITLFVMVVSKRLFAGIMAGFSYWMLESISRGAMTKAFSIYVMYIPEKVPYFTNRLYLYSVAIVLMAFTVVLLNRRERWVLSEEFD